MKPPEIDRIEEKAELLYRRYGRFGGQFDLPATVILDYMRWARDNRMFVHTCTHKDGRDGVILHTGIEIYSVLETHLDV